MTHEEARKVVDAFTAGIVNEDGDWQPSAEQTLTAAALRDPIGAVHPAWAFATIWREDVETPGFEFPPVGLVVMVECLIGEPVWGRRYYNDQGRVIDSWPPSLLWRSPGSLRRAPRRISSH
jgi:hypothetical protein